MATLVAVQLSRPSPQQPAPMPEDTVTPVQVTATAEKRAESGEAHDRLGLKPPEGLRPYWMMCLPPDATEYHAQSSDEMVPVYTCRGAGTAVVAVLNRRANTAAVRITTQLSAGICTVERFLLNTLDQSALPSGGRMEAVANQRAGEAVRNFKLAPNHLLLLRFSNRTAQAAGLLDRVRGLLAAAFEKYPDAARQMKVPWSDCREDLNGVASSAAASRRNTTAKTIHQRMLELTHLQALCRNAVNNGRLGSLGADLLSSLVSLETALGELSAGCLNLLPSMEYDPKDGHLRIALANAGEASVSRVRIGVASVKGLSVTPGDEALFPLLAPRQTVRSEVSISLTEIGPEILAADISFFLGNRPARLRVGIL
jgi:hypothetical protein